MFRGIIVLQALLNHPTNVLHQIQYNKNFILAKKRKRKKKSIFQWSQGHEHP
jgi:hypothetical protein